MIVKNKTERRLLEQDRQLQRQIVQDATRGFRVTLAYLQRFPHVTRKRILNAALTVCD